MSLLLSGVVLSIAAASATVEVAPGADLAQPLSLPAGDRARYGLDGSPPGARGDVPAAPASPGQHHLVVYSEEGEPERWLRFIVAGEPGAPPELVLAVDRSPPDVRLDATGTVEREGTRYAGRRTALEVSADDPSGLAGEPSVQLAGQRLGEHDAPAWPTDDRTITLTARASDALGNVGESAPLQLTLDRQPPQLAAVRAEAREGVAPDIVASGEPIQLRLHDAGAGLQSLQLDGSAHPLQPGTEQSLTLAMPAGTKFTLTDRLGNVAEGDLPLRLDNAPPRLMLVSDGQPQPAADGARLPRSERLELLAEDPLAGVARACVELSIWYHECRPLPLTLVGIDPGRYRVVFRAVDRLGHKASERFEIEVLP